MRRLPAALCQRKQPAGSLHHRFTGKTGGFRRGQSLAFLACLTCLSSAGLAQEPRRTEESFIPSYSAASAQYLWGARTDLKDFAGASMAQQEAGALAQYPLYRTDRARFTAGVRYRWTQLDFDGSSPIAQGTLDLHRLQIPFNYWRSLGEQWKLWAGVEPGLFTDFNALSDEDFTVSALAVVAYEWRPEWSVSFGAYYSRDLGEDRVLPVLGLIWRPNPHWNLAATFPRFRVAYAPNEQWVFDVTVRPGGSGWNIRTDGGEDLNLEYKSWRAGAGVERLLTTSFPGKLSAFVEVGVGFAQDLKLKDGSHERFASNLDETLILSGGLRLRF